MTSPFTKSSAVPQWNRPGWRLATLEDMYEAIGCIEDEYFYLCPHCRHELDATPEVEIIPTSRHRTYVCWYCRIVFRGMLDLEEEMTPPHPVKEASKQNCADTQTHEATVETARCSGGNPPDVTREQVYHNDGVNVPANLRYLLK